MTWTVISRGPIEDRWAWSGTPWSLCSALRRRGIPVHRMSSDLPAPMERIGIAVARRIPTASVIGADNPGLVVARNARLRSLRAGRGAELVLGIGSEFTWPHVDVTLEDMTVAQSPLPSSVAKERWIRRQRGIYHRARCCLAATPWVQESHLTDYGLARDKTVVVGLGANVECRPVPKDWRHPRILWVGVDWQRKGGNLLLRAFAQAKIPGATLDLVGQHPRIDQDGVVGHGMIRDEARLRAFFEQATLFVLPSAFDPYGIVFLEAATAGTPVIGTDTGGARYAVGPSGQVIPPDDLPSLVDAMCRLTDPVVAESYRQAALAHARAHTWNAVAHRIAEALQTRGIASG